MLRVVAELADGGRYLRSPPPGLCLVVEGAGPAAGFLGKSLAGQAGMSFFGKTWNLMGTTRQVGGRELSVESPRRTSRRKVLREEVSGTGSRVSDPLRRIRKTPNPMGTTWEAGGR